MQWYKLHENVSLLTILHILLTPRAPCIYVVAIIQYTAAHEMCSVYYASATLSFRLYSIASLNVSLGET